MREDVRRLLLFVATLVTGLLMIGVDLPLVQLLPVLVLIGLLLLFATGALSAEDIRHFGGRFRRGGKEKPREKEKKEPAKKTVPPKNSDKGGPGIFTRIRSSLQELIPERVPRKEGEKKGGLFSRGKKDNSVKERLVEKSPAPDVPAQPSQSAASPAGGGKAEDPFLSLSDDELQTDLLDELDDLDEMDAPIPKQPDGLSLDMEGFTPPEDSGLQGADAILNDNASDLEEFTDLEGIDQIDSELASLDDADLDEIQLSGLDELEGLEDAGMGAPGIPDGSPDEIPDMTAALTAPPPDVPHLSLPQDALPDQSSKNAPDMAAFAAGSGGDNNMLSLLASDVKSVKIEADMSVLRDLRDVKVSSEDLVTELEGLLHVIGMPEVKVEKKGNKALKR